MTTLDWMEWMERTEETEKWNWGWKNNNKG